MGNITHRKQTQPEAYCARFYRLGMKNHLLAFTIASIFALAGVGCDSGMSNIHMNWFMDGGIYNVMDGSGRCDSNCPTSEMVLIPSGPFMMGCNEAVDKECKRDEKPYHSVDVPTFKIDKYEVTAAEYGSCVAATGCTAASTADGCNYDVMGRENHPINCVDWKQAKAYCAWAGKKLPTEAEWEKAARGTDGRKYPWGNDALDCNRAVHSAKGCSNMDTAVVGSKPLGASPYGALDMVGNVSEWVEDDYHSDYSGVSIDGSVWIDNPRSTYRVSRGGSWHYDDSKTLRASSRVWGTPMGSGPDGGFRCAVASR